ncbi:MAG: sugar phosphate isomerase/epimerase [Phycisphaerales bacterium]|nr:sugar phosphate isomerase/epimerase [Phycisphaerales bacterium]
MSSTITLSAFADEAGPSAAEQIAALKQAGLKHIDIRNIDGHNITVLPLDHARKIKDQLDAAGISVLMYGSPLGKIDIADDFAIDLAKLKHLGQLKPILGASAVRIFSYYNKPKGGGKSPAEFRKESLSRLKQLKTLASDLGLVLYHENERHIFGDRSDDVLTIAQELRDPAPNGTFKMIFDFGNYVVGNEPVWAAWLKLRDTTDAFHFKDNKQTPTGEHHHVPVGQGFGCIPQIIADAVHRHFTGPATIEPHLQHSPAVLATGPGGIPNQAYSKMPLNDSFQIACQAAKELLAQAGVAIFCGKSEPRA